MSVSGVELCDDWAEVCRVAARFGFEELARGVRHESENTTYLLEGRDGARLVLRRYRPGYHARAAIEVELAYQQAARAAGIVEVPEVLEDQQGHTLVASHGSLYAAFAHAEGDEPEPEALRGLAPSLGRMAARLGQVGREMEAVAEVRFAWDDTALGRWGPLSAPGAATMEAMAVVRRRLARARQELPRTLRHADLRPANLKVLDGRIVAVLDFDDCGRTFAGFDLAASLSFLEADRALVAQFAPDWREGYEQVEPLLPEEWAVVGDLIMLRRLLLSAWLVSHPHAEVPGVAPREYLAGTEELAESYLAGGILR